MPLVRRTRATLRRAEFGFFGVCVNTRTHTPRFCGLSCSAGLLVLVMTAARPLRTNWLIVGTIAPHAPQPWARRKHGVPGLGSRISGPAPGTDLPYKVDELAPADSACRWGRYRCSPHRFSRSGSLRCAQPDEFSARQARAALPSERRALDRVS